MLSRLLKVNLNWIRVTTTEFSRKNYRTNRDNQNSSKLSWETINKTPKGHTKIYPLFSVQFQSIGYAKYSLQEWNPKKKLDFTLMDQQ